MSDITNTPYSERTDLQKIEFNWHRTKALYGKREFSSAIARAGTAAELAVNFAIREELQSKRRIEASFVDSLLKWANGIAGKLRNILLPVSAVDRTHQERLRDISQRLDKANSARNMIVHGGRKGTRGEAKEWISAYHGCILTLVKSYSPTFALEWLPPPKKRSGQKSPRRRRNVMPTE